MKIQIKKTIQKSQRDKSILLVANRVEAGIRTRDFSPWVTSDKGICDSWATLPSIFSYPGKWWFYLWIFFPQNCGNGILLPKLFWPTVRKNCSSDRENSEGWFAKILRSLEWFVFTVKGQNNFWWRNAFLTCSWRFLRYDNLEKFIGI